MVRLLKTRYHREATLNHVPGDATALQETGYNQLNMDVMRLPTLLVPRR